MSRPNHQWSMSSRGGLAIEETGLPEPAGSSFGSLPFLSVEEAERLVEHFPRLRLEDIGSKKFLKAHLDLEKLNAQAHQSASQRSDEFVVEALLTFETFPSLVQNLIVVEVWKERVLPLLPSTSPQQRLVAYFILHHEALLTNLLEVFLYHGHVVESLGEGQGGEAMLELVDFVARKLVYATAYEEEFRESFKGGNLSSLSSSSSSSSSSLMPEKGFDAMTEEEKQVFLESLRDRVLSIEQEEKEQAMSSTLVEALGDQVRDMQFKLVLSSLSVARYLAEHIDKLPLNAINRMLDTHDFLLLLLPLIENPPWTRRRVVEKAGKREVVWEKVQDFVWQRVEPADLMKVTTLEAQLWFAVFFLTGSAAVVEKYHFHNFRKNSLLRVRKFLNHLLLDQLPILANLQRFMDELAISDVPEPTRGTTGLICVEEVTSLRDGLLRQSQDYFQEMADLGERWGDPGNKAVAKAMEELSTFYTSFDR